MSWLILLLDKQYFRFKPKRALVPVGSLVSFQRLWKVRFVGCCKGFVLRFCVMLLKFCCSWSLAFAWNPKVFRQYCLV